MITSSQSRIDEYTAKGWWGTDTLHGLLAKAVAKNPERLAVADQPNRQELVAGAPLRISYQDLDIYSDRVAEQLLKQGITLGDKIIVQLPNIVELVITYYAASKIGAIISPIAVQYGKHEIKSISELLNTPYFITIDAFKTLPLAATAIDLGLTVFSYQSKSETPVTALNFTDKIETKQLSQLRNDHAEQLNDANNIISICWTSGTTGTPKGVPRSHNMWLATTYTEIDSCDYREGDKLLNPFPLINMAAIGAFLFPTVVINGSLFLHHPLDPPLYLKQIHDEKINYTIAPPALMNELAKSKDMWKAFDFSSLRHIGSGSAPLAPWMIEVFSKDYGIEVINFYGSNEGICLLSTDKITPLAQERAIYFPRLGYANIPWQGTVFNSTKTKVCHIETGEEITEVGQKGELLIAGPTIFDGYYNAEQGYSAAGCFTDDGYFKTGDMVEICGDPAIFYKIVGRCKDIINRGGMKISPTEIDTLLDAHPDIKEAAVCAYPDERLGEKICAFVVANAAEKTLSLADITEYLNEVGIAKYKLPERIESIAILPRNPMGKVKRFELQAILEEKDAS